MAQATSHTNGQLNGTTPKITLYTNHGCPWAHRAHITLKELGLAYEEVIIDLDTPRPAWYLEINPRGLVPSIKYGDEILTESGIVSQFLADSYPSHLLPPSNASNGALTRARIGFFVDTFFTKVNGKIFEGLRAADDSGKAAASAEVFGAIKKEIEPLLENAGPYFNGAAKMTLAEALTGPFVLRLHAYARAGLLAETLEGELKGLPNYSAWAGNLVKQECVTCIWDEEGTMKRTKVRIEKMRAAAK
jgi:glutathione S-transferase